MEQKQSQSLSERRIAERINLNLKLRYKTTETSDPWHSSECINISSTGAFIRTASPPKPGTQLDFEIFLSPKSHNKSLKVKGEVIWNGDCVQRIFTHHLGNLSRRVKGMGIHFDKPSLGEAQELKEFFSIQDNDNTASKMVQNNPLVQKFRQWFS